MNAIWADVILLADMMRSPSFSRSGESRTTRNSPLRKTSMHDSIESNCGSDCMPLASGCVCGTKVVASADSDIVRGRQYLYFGLAQGRASVVVRGGSICSDLDSQTGANELLGTTAETSEFSPWY